MAEQDKPTLVPSVLNDLVDVDGTPAEGDGLTYTSGAWRPGPPVPFWFEAKLGAVTLATTTGHAQATTVVELKQNTDVMPGTPASTGDVLIAQGDIDGYSDGKDVLVIQRDGTYDVGWYSRCTADPLDNATPIILSAYFGIDNEDYGPLYYTVPSNTLVVNASAQVQSIEVNQSATAWLPAGTQLTPLLFYRADHDPISAQFGGSITRLR